MPTKKPETGTVTLRFQMTIEMRDFCERMAHKAGDEKLQAFIHRAVVNEARRVEAEPTADEKAKRAEFVNLLRLALPDVDALGDFLKK